MIVPAMSVTEIHNELVKDYDNCISRIDRDFKHYRRAIIKSTKFPMYFKPIDYTTPSRNKFVILVEAESKKNANDLLITLIGYYLRPEGIYAAMIVPSKNGDKKICIYPPHFFERYKERYLQNDLSALEVIKQYFKINSAITFEVREEAGFRGVCRDGYILGKILSHNILIVKTFVTIKMLKGEQVALRENYAAFLNNHKNKKNLSQGLYKYILI